MISTKPSPATSSEDAASFRAFVRQKAAAANAPISYRDEQGRWVEEWPATGEKWELHLDEQGNRTRVTKLA